MMTSLPSERFNPASARPGMESSQPTESVKRREAASPVPQRRRTQHSTAARAAQHSSTASKRARLETRRDEKQRVTRPRMVGAAAFRVAVLSEEGIAVLSAAGNAASECSLQPVRPPCSLQGFCLE